MLTKERIDCAILDLQNECANYMADLDCGEKSQCDKCYIPTALEALESINTYRKKMNSFVELIENIFKESKELYSDCFELFNMFKNKYIDWGDEE
ncbi:MAG: hypothetical protein ACI4E1_07710 [Lachnospira sp.]